MYPKSASGYLPENEKKNSEPGLTRSTLVSAFFEFDVVTLYINRNNISENFYNPVCKVISL